MKKFKRILVVGAAATMLFGNVLNVSAAGLHDIFDAKYYADSYADLKEAFGYDENLLYQHFLTYGLKEGRNMSPILNVVAYRKAYSDLNAAFGDNWDAYVDHFFTFGAREMRDKGVLFNPVVYANSYGDIKAVYGNNLASIAEHYLTFGRAEHRTLGTSDGYADMAAARIAELEARQDVQQSDQSSQQPIRPATPSSLWNSSGHTEYIYDDRGNRITEIYYDIRGNIMSSYHAAYNSNDDILYFETRDSEGNRLFYAEYVYDGKKIQKETYYNYNGNGTVTSYSIYAWTGNKVKISYYDESGNPDGYSECETDDNFNITKQVDYDNNGVLLESNECTYNENGKPLITFSCNAAGEVTSKAVFTYYANGIRKTSTYIRDNQKNVYEYNENGNELSNKMYSDDKLVFTYTNEYYPEGPLAKTYLEQYASDGSYYSNRLFYYDKQGRKLKEIERDEYATGKLITLVTEYAADGSYTSTREDYDSNGKLVAKRYDSYNAQDELVQQTSYDFSDDGVTVLEIENGRLVKVSNYEADGVTLTGVTTYTYVKTDYGYEETKKELNADGSIISTSIHMLDENDHILGEKRYLSDDGGMVEDWYNDKTLYYTADGNLRKKVIWDNQNTIKAVYEYEADGTEIALVKNEQGEWVRPSEDSNTNELKSTFSASDAVSVNISNDATPSGSVSDGNAVTGDVSGNNAADN